MDIAATAVVPPRFIKTILRINAIMELEILLKNSEEPFANKERNCFAGIFPDIKRSSNFFRKKGSKEKKLPIAILIQLARAAPRTPASKTTINRKSSRIFSNAVIIFRAMLYV